jgi:hypothetical protein
MRTERETADCHTHTARAFSPRSSQDRTFLPRQWYLRICNHNNGSLPTTLLSCLTHDFLKLALVNNSNCPVVQYINPAQPTSDIAHSYGYDF